MPISRIRNLSFRARLILLTVVFMSLPSVINLFISYSSSSQALREQYIEGASGLLRVAAQNLDSYYTDISSFIDFPYANTNLLNYIGDKEVKDSYFHNSYVSDALNTVVFNRRELSALSFYAQRWDKLFIIDHHRFTNHTVTSPSVQWTGELSGAELARFNQTAWIYVSPVDQLKSDRRESDFTLRRSIFYNFAYLGMLYVDFKNTYLEKISSSIRTNDEEFVFIMDLEGRPLYASDSSWDATKRLALAQAVQASNGITNTIHFKLNNDSTIVNYYKLEHFPWLLVKGISSHVVDRNIDSMVWLNIAIQISFTLGGILCAILLSIWLYRPLLRLVRAIQRVNQGELDFKIVPSGGSEIVKIINSFNNMMTNLHQLIENEYKTKIRLQEAQMKALQAQINPHFLYNAFQLIGSMAIEKDVEEINEVTNSLARMCRYSIAPGQNVVALREEIEHIYHFMKIQKLRFRDDLEYVIQIDEDLKQLPLPKLSLLPLIENCFVHGIKHRQGLAISLLVTRQGPNIYIRIADNGQGITKQRLIQVREWLGKDNESVFERERLGLANVQERMIHYYGAAARLQIESGTDGGTVVSFRFSYIGGE